MNYTKRYQKFRDEIWAEFERTVKQGADLTDSVGVSYPSGITVKGLPKTDQGRCWFNAIAIIANPDYVLGIGKVTFLDYTGTCEYPEPDLIHHYLEPDLLDVVSLCELLDDRKPNKFDTVDSRKLEGNLSYTERYIKLIDEIWEEFEKTVKQGAFFEDYIMVKYPRGARVKGLLQNENDDSYFKAKAIIANPKYVMQIGEHLKVATGKVTFVDLENKNHKLEPDIMDDYWFCELLDKRKSIE